MIIDSHAHAFPPMGGPSGFVSSERHAMYTQHGLAHHHQPVRRFSDQTQVREQTLCDGEDVTLDGLTDVGFRGGGSAGSRGRPRARTATCSTSRRR